MSSSARIDELRKKFDENPRRYFAPLANEYRKVGDFDQAIFICQEYLPQQPGHMSGHIVFGQALFEAKRLPEARTVFETALTLDPENLIALRHLADISRELGETTAARGWYERVLQADPRNEEIAAIMASMPAAGSASAPTAEAPAVVAPAAPAAPPPLPKPAPASAAAPTMELSAAAVQELVRARQATQEEQAPPPEKLTLDEAPTVEVNAPTAATLEGFESTSHEGPLDIPSGGMLGLEPTAAAGSNPEPTGPATVPDGLEALTLDDFSLPTPASVPSPSAAAPPTPKPEDSGGLLDFDSFELGGGAAAPAPPTAAPSIVAPAMDFAMPTADAAAATPPPLPADAGSEVAGDFDFDIPVSPPAAPPPASPPKQESIPTMAIDMIEEAIPAVVDIIEETIPAVVDAVVSAPTVIMEAIRTPPPKTPEPPVVAKEPPKRPDEPAPTQQMNVAEVMQHVEATRRAKAEPETAAERSAAPFVTETMAQLYLEQGHRDEAIDIYRQLVAARPGDADLRGRLEAIERGVGSKAPPTLEVPAASASATAAPAPRRFAASGPTIRTVLRELFGIEGQSTNGREATNGGGQGEMGSIDILFSAESASDTLGPLAAAFDGGYVAPSGSIDAVFASDSQ